MQGLNRHGDTQAPISAQEATRLFDWLKRWPRLALAVSGGGDSLALMHLAAEWAARTPDAPGLHVLTVDHVLQPRSAEVAEDVCRRAAALNLPCALLRWRGEKPAAGIEAAARQARYDLMAQWCQQHGAALVVAHTLEDQAETFLMRLARGSGIDGLGGMARQGHVPGAHPPVALLRPLLEVPRARLRASLRARDIDWHEDPANRDTRFERVRLRQLLPLLAEHGLTPRAIATSARRLRRARRALQGQTQDFLQRHARLHSPGWAEIARDAFEALPEELRLRVLARLVGHLGGGGAPLRDMAGLERLLDWLARPDAPDTPPAQVLAGAHVARRQRVIVIGREPGRAAAPLRLTPEHPRGLWDRRFEIVLEGLSAPVRVVMLAEVEATGIPPQAPRRPKNIPAFAWRAQPAIIDAEARLRALPASGWRAAETPFRAASATLLPPW